MNKKLYTFIVPVLIMGMASILPGCGESGPSKKEKAELTIWGVFEDSDIYQPLIADFNEEYPNVKINYYKKTIQDYEEDLLETMAEGTGPDIFMLHHTWLPRYINKVLPAPVEMITFTDVKNDYVDVVVNDFIEEGLVYALPLSVDTLALYYNKDVFNTNGLVGPPANWEEFLDDVEKITVRNGEEVVLAGAAIGTAYNVNRSADILSLLMIQSGAQMTNEEKTATFNQPIASNGEDYYIGARSLLFYTDFANPLKQIYTWNNLMDYSIDVFSQGKAAMMFNYSYHIPTIRAKSPYLNFDVAPMPQIKTSEIDVNYANYWGLAVSRNTLDYEMAWQFIDWLTQSENAKKYLESTGQPAARRDLISWQQSDPDLGVFANQSLTAYSWYQKNNLLIEQYFANMIESVVTGKATIDNALTQAANEVNLLMR